MDVASKILFKSIEKIAGIVTNGFLGNGSEENLKNLGKGTNVILEETTNTVIDDDNEVKR